MDVQNGDINVIVVKDDKFEDIIAVEKKVICDRAEEAREVETSHQTGVSDVTSVRDDHDHEDKHFEEAHKVKPEDETLHQTASMKISNLEKVMKVLKLRSWEFSGESTLGEEESFQSDITNVTLVCDDHRQIYANDAVDKKESQ